MSIGILRKALQNILGICDVEISLARKNTCINVNIK